MTKRTFNKKSNRAIEPLKLAHSYVYGFKKTQTRGGYEYFITFIDDYLRYGFVYLMHRKSKAF